jgi:predicted RNA polymerase sigma factor
MVSGPAAGLEALDAVTGMAEHHRVDAVRGHLLEMAGDRAGAREAYRLAARRTTSLPERRYLDERAARLT